MKYDSKTKKCKCEEKLLTFEDACEVCQRDYELWCDELAIEEIEAEPKEVKTKRV
jgi:hypothetical protein